MNQTRIKTIFHFHELSLPVIEHEGGEFVPVKPIIEHIGMNWRTALRTLQTDFRTKFFSASERATAQRFGWLLCHPNPRYFAAKSAFLHCPAQPRFVRQPRRHPRRNR